jgi:hypothetical protein
MRLSVFDVAAGQSGAAAFFFEDSGSAPSGKPKIRTLV